MPRALAESGENSQQACVPRRQSPCARVTICCRCAHPTPLPVALPGGVLHGHVPLRCACDSPHPRSHPAWSWSWDLVLHHTQVGETHRCHGGLIVSFIVDPGWGEPSGMGLPGMVFGRRGQNSCPRESLCPLLQAPDDLGTLCTQEIFNEKG